MHVRKDEVFKSIYSIDKNKRTNKYITTLAQPRVLFYIHTNHVSTILKCYTVTLAYKKICELRQAYHDSQFGAKT